MSQIMAAEPGDQVAGTESAVRDSFMLPAKQGSLGAGKAFKQV